MRHILKKSQRVTIRMIADELNISEGSIHKILTKDLGKRLYQIRTTFLDWRSKTSAHCCIERFDWNGWKRWRFFTFDCYGWWELVLRVRSLNKTSIIGLAESKSIETSKSMRCEIKNQDNAHGFFQFKRNYPTRIHSSSQDSEWWVMGRSYEPFNLPDSLHKTNIDRKW